MPARKTILQRCHPKIRRAVWLHPRRQKKMEREYGEAYSPIVPLGCGQVENTILGEWSATHSRSIFFKPFLKRLGHQHDRHVLSLFSYWL